RPISARIAIGRRSANRRPGGPPSAGCSCRGGGSLLAAVTLRCHITRFVLLTGELVGTSTAPIPLSFEHATRRSSPDGSGRPPVLDRVFEALSRHYRRAALHRRDREGAGAFPPDPRAIGRTGATAADRPRSRPGRALRHRQGL